MARASRSSAFAVDPHSEHRGSKLRAFAFQSSQDMISRNLASATLISVCRVWRYARDTHAFTPIKGTVGLIALPIPQPWNTGHGPHSGNRPLGVHTLLAPTRAQCGTGGDAETRDARASVTDNARGGEVFPRA